MERAEELQVATATSRLGDELGGGEIFSPQTHIQGVIQSDGDGEALLDGE